MATKPRMESGSFSAGYGETGMEPDAKASAQLPEFRRPVPLFGQWSRSPPRLVVGLPRKSLVSWPGRQEPIGRIRAKHNASGALVLRDETPVVRSRFSRLAECQA